MTIWQGLILNGTEVINMPTVVGTAIFNTTDQRIVFGQYLAAASTQWSLDNTQAQLVLALGSSHGRQFIIGSNGWVGNDCDHALQTNPTLYVHSATNPNTANTEWLSAAHNQTDALITTGKGKLLLEGAGGAAGFVATGTTVPFQALVGDGDLYIDGNLEGNGYGFFIGALGAGDAIWFHTTDATHQRLGGVRGLQAHGLLIAPVETNGYLNNNVIICTYNNQNTNHSKAVQANPTLWIESNNNPSIATTEWLNFVHNQTDGVIATGKGDIILNPITEITEVCGVGLKTKEYNATVNDDATISLPASTTGWGAVMAGDNQEFARFRWTSAAVVTIDESTANVATSDLDTNLCIFDGGTSVSIRNRLGANLTVRYVIHYS